MRNPPNSVKKRVDVCPRRKPVFYVMIDGGYIQLKNQTLDNGTSSIYTYTPTHPHYIYKHYNRNTTSKVKQKTANPLKTYSCRKT